MISRLQAFSAKVFCADAVGVFTLITTLIPVLVGPVRVAAAQPDSTHRPVVGLVLSGGSARGLAHVGVLKVLERERIPVDIVTGTSMGALVGGLYALGYNAADLERVALEQDWDGLFSDRISRRSALLERRTASRGVMVSVPFKGTEVLLPSGLLSGQRIMTTLSRLTWGYHDLDDLTQLERPFTAVATHLRSGEAHALTNQPLATAMRASISLPSVFRPVRIDGQLYIDGGVARNIPAVDALDLGADFLIAVDVGEALDSTATERLSFLDVLVETAFFQAARLDEAQRQLVDVLIQPDVSGLTRASFADAAEWIRRGEEAAEAVLPQLRQLAGLSPLPASGPRKALPERAFVSEIIVRGVHDGGIELVHARLKLQERTWLTPDEIEDAISRVFGTGLFDEVTYRVVPHPRRGGGSGFTGSVPSASLDDALLDIVVVPSEAPNRVGVGFRYDSRYKSAVLLDATFWGVDVSNAVTALRARFGDQLSLSASYSARSGRRSRFNLGARGAYADAPVDVFMPRSYMTTLGFSPDVPLFAVSLGTASTDLFAAFASRESLRAGARVRMAHVFVEDRVAGRRQSPDTTASQTPVPLLVTRDQDFASAGAFVEFDTLDDLDFPTRGAIVSASGEMGISNAQPFVGLPDDQADPDPQPNAGPFLHIAARTTFAVPATRSVSIHGRGAFMYGSGAHLPAVYYTYLGGRETVTVLGNSFVSMYGLQAQERFGRAGYLGEIGVQWEARTGLFAKASVNIGDSWDPLGGDLTDTLPGSVAGLLDESISVGVGLEVAIRTRVGPVRLIAAIGDRDEPVNLGFQFGFDF